MSVSFHALRQRWRRHVNVVGPGAAAVSVALAVLFLAAVIYLLVTRGPWEKALRKKLNSGGELNFRHYMQLGVGWGAVALAGLSAAALALGKWWMRPCAAPMTSRNLRPPSRLALFFYVLSLAIVVATACYYRLPRLTHSFCNDEEMGFRKYVWGEYVVDGSGGLTLKRTTWDQALFDNETGNNHIWSTVETRLALALFPAKDAANPPGFKEATARLFPFASGLLAVAALAFLGVVLGNPRMGLFAALVLAFSPWHIRYSVEIRGYSTMLLGLLLSLACLVRAMETGRWRWWIGFSASQVLCLLSSAGALWVVVFVNVLALSAIVLRGRDRLGNALRLGVANVFSLAPLAVLFAPAVPQISASMKNIAMPQSQIDVSWLGDLWNHLTVGVLGSAGLAGDSGWSVEQIKQSTPWAGLALNGLLPVLAGGGLLLMLFKDWRTRIVVGGILLGAAMALLQNHLAKTPFFPWHMIYVLPLFCLAVVWLGSLAPARLTIVPLVAVVALMLVGTDARERVMKVPRQPIREAAWWARRESAQETPTGRKNLGISAVFGTSARQALSYDPRSVVVKTPADFEALQKEALERKVPLRVFFCDRPVAQIKHPALLSMLEGLKWERIAKLRGMELKYTYEVYQWLETAPEETVPDSERINVSPPQPGASQP